ncbi:MAG: protein kinase, partial [Prevotella sp.]|nr:protein kinase [Prevotella sp.]
MDTSQFTDNQPMFDSLEPIPTRGATCDTFRVKVYGKMHFLKRLKPEYSGDIRYKEAFRKEFETGYRLEHPHLVRYVSSSDEGILMEYVDGETLTHLLSNNAEYFKDKKNTDKLLLQLLDAVGYLHNHQVLHLDLKPDNILLTRINNDVKLIDLGCCYTDTFQDTQGRTDSFAAPEQLSGDTTDVRTDIFAIGKIMACLPNSSIYNKVIERCT